VGWLVAAGLIGMCLALVLLPRRTVDARALASLRCFFPSWRFFEEIEPGPTLHYCVAAPNEDFGDWQQALVPKSRGPTALVLNAQGNLALAYHSLVEQLWNDLEEAADAPPSTLIGYALVTALVQSVVLAPAERSPGTRFRFRLSSDGCSDFESEVHEVQPAR
jgi:hypothetical protein